MELLQCPCCDHFTLEERAAWEDCPVCFWEDDGKDLDRLDAPSTCNNGLTLRQGRENFRRIGACELQFAEYVCSAEEQAQYRYAPRE